MSFLGNAFRALTNAVHTGEQAVVNNVAHPVEQAVSHATHPIVQAAHNIVTNVQHPSFALTNFRQSLDSSAIHPNAQTKAAMRPQVFPQYGPSPTQQVAGDQMAWDAWQKDQLPIVGQPAAPPLSVRPSGANQLEGLTPENLNQMYMRLHSYNPQNQLLHQSGYGLQNPGNYIQGLDQNGY